MFREADSLCRHTVAVFHFGITQCSFCEYVLPVKLFSFLYNEHLKTLLRWASGDVNTVTGVWNFVLLRTQTDASQFMSQFLILSHFSSLYYFKKFLLELPK